MSDICVFDIERRKSKHEDWAGKDERNSYPVPIDRLRFLIEIKQREQSDLWNELEQRDSKKIQIIRTSFAVFSLFVTGLIALFTLVQEPKELILTKEFTLLFSLVLVGMGLINYSLIKYIIAFKHSRLLFIRQINCIRHAKEAYAYALIEGKYPLSTEDLYFEEGKNIEEQSAYYRTFGRHRK